jgi:hypothetical protein
MKTTFKTVALLFAVVAFSACAKKKDDYEVRGNRTQQAGPSLLPTGQGSLAGRQSAQVTLPNQAQLDDAVKILVSATFSPESLGNVRSIEMRGQVTVDPRTGAVQNSNSNISLVIVDSLVGTVADGREVQPIQINLGNATGVAANYNANLTFADQYGTISINGTYNLNTFQGTVTFANTQGNGFNGRKSGTLGQFSIPTCAFFVCQ